MLRRNVENTADIATRYGLFRWAWGSLRRPMLVKKKHISIRMDARDLTIHQLALEALLAEDDG